jgi:uncharacterized paraquat-inducible protein A
MDRIELGGLLLGLSLFVFLGMIFPPLLLVTAAVGCGLILLGNLRRDRRQSTEPSDLVECPNCHGLEEPDRATCRFCDAPLSGERKA